MWKWFVGGIVVLGGICGGGGWFLINSETVKSLVHPEEKPIEVRLGDVRVDTLVRTVGAPGNIEPKRIVKISAQVSARIKELPFEEGDQVHQGDVVVRLDDEELQAALESSEANLKVQEALLAQARVGLDSAKSSLQSEKARLTGAEAALDEASAQVGRVRELYDSKDRALADLQRAEASFQQAQANVEVVRASVDIAGQGVRRAEAGVLGGLAGIEVSRAQIRRARKDLANATIVSPIDGSITRLDKEVGELVVLGTLNNPASVIMEIADLSEVLLKARVDEANVTDVRAGQGVDIYINAYADEVFKGTVRRVGQQRLTHSDGSYYFETEVVVELGEGQTLRSGLTASCDILVQTIPDAMQVPSQAVLSRRIADLPQEVVDGTDLIDKNKTFTYVVYRVEDGHARAVPVRIGASDLKNTMIVAGLSAEDRVIAGPYKVLEDLHNDQLVRVEGEDPIERVASSDRGDGVDAGSGG